MLRLAGLRLLETQFLVDDDPEYYSFKVQDIEVICNKMPPVLLLMIGFKSKKTNYVSRKCLRGETRRCEVQSSTSIRCKEWHSGALECVQAMTGTLHKKSSAAGCYTTLNHFARHSEAGVRINVCSYYGYHKLGYSAQHNFILDGKLCKLEASVTISNVSCKFGPPTSSSY